MLLTTTKIYLIKINLIAAQNSNNLFSNKIYFYYMITHETMNENIFVIIDHFLVILLFRTKIKSLIRPAARESGQNSVSEINGKKS